jgi:hypothetical protein
MPVCSEVVPPEITFNDGVRVACHLYTADGIGRPVALPDRDASLEAASAPPAALVFVADEDAP